MTTPSYTEDLTDIATGDESSGWTDFSTNDQGSPSYQDNEYPYIQGSYAITQTCSKSKTVANLCYDYGSDTNVGTDEAIFIWQYFASPFSMDDYAGTTTGQAGMCVLMGNSTSNFDIWEVGGQDIPPNPYGGFTCHAVCPSVTADDISNGPRTSEQFIGAQINLTAYPSKGEPHSVDCMRFGRGSAIFEYGETSDYCTIAGFAAQNDSQSNRWGLIQEVSGGYLWQGRMQFGSASNLVDFRDSNVTIFIKWNPKVTANFNTIEVLNASSNIEMTGFQFIVLDTTTASKGRWITTNDATVELTSCLFQDMSTFVFDSNTTLTTCTFTRCALVTQGGATLDGCLFDEPSGAVGMLVDDPGLIDNSIFVSDGTGHAIELTSDCAGNTYTLTGMTVSGYASSNGSTGNEVIYNNSGGAVTINVDGGSGVSALTVRNGTSASTTIQASFVFTITGLEQNTEVTVVTAGTTTVLYHLENATVSDGDGKYKAEYTHSGGGTIDVLIHHVNYKPDISNILGVTLPSVNSSAKVTMFEDENYYNPA